MLNVINLETLVVAIFAFDNLLRELNGTFTIVYLAYEKLMIIRHMIGSILILKTFILFTMHIHFKNIFIVNYVGVV